MIIYNKQITIGDHCMLSWGMVITDNWVTPNLHSLEVRRAMLQAAAHNPVQRFPFIHESRPVIVEDNCGIGFDAVILPGVRLGRGCVVGCKTIVQDDVPPYAVVVGNPANIIRFLSPNDTEYVRQHALRECVKRT